MKPPEDLSNLFGDGTKSELKVKPGEEGSASKLDPLGASSGVKRRPAPEPEGAGSSESPPSFGVDESPGRFGSFDTDGSEALPSRPSADGFDQETSKLDPASVTASYREWVNEDGSRTAEVAPGAVRFKSGSKWIDYDMDLVAGKDGSFVPESTDRDVSFDPSDPNGLISVDGLVFAAPEAVGGKQATVVRSEGAKVVAEDWLPSANGLVAGRAGEPQVVTAPLVSGAELAVRFASRAQAGDGSWVQQVRVPAGVVARQDGADGVVFLDAKGDSWYRFGGGRAFDDSGSVAAVGAVSVTLVGQDTDGVTIKVAADQKWLADPSLKFPITVDPPIAATGTTVGDVSMGSATPTTNGGSASYMTAGSYLFGSTMVQNVSLIGFNLPSGAKSANSVVRSSSLSVWQNATSAPWCTPSDSWLTTVGGSWAENSVTWNTRPGADPHPSAFWHGARNANMTCGSGWQNYTPTQQVQRWITYTGSGAIGLPSTFGVRLSEAAGAYGLVPPTAGTAHQFATREGGASHAPLLSFTYEKRPPQPTAAGPADDAHFASTTPTLSVNPVTDGDGDSVRYWYRVWTSQSDTVTGSTFGTLLDGVGGEYVDSGWVSGTSWTVPDGALADGGVYYWTVMADDGHSPAAPARWFRSFSIDSSANGDAPSDSFGPVGVSLVDGSFSTGAGSHGIETVSGNLGVDVSYDSSGALPAGLTGEYFRDVNNNNTIDGPDQLLGKQNDRSVSYEFRANDAPFPGLSMTDTLIRWTGTVKVPTSGSYKFGTPLFASTGAKIRVNNTTILNGLTAYPDGTDYAESSAISLTAGTAYPIEVTARLDLVLGATFHLQYDSGGGRFFVPGTWLTPKWSPPSPLGAGWNAGVTGDAMVARVQIDGGDQAILYDGADDQLGTFTRVNEGPTPLWVPEPDLAGATLLTMPGNKLQLTMFGMVSTFTNDGLLESERTADSSTNTAGQTPAIDYTYVPMPTAADGTRLSQQLDPVTQRKADLIYSGITSAAGACHTPPGGFDASLPTGRLCRVKFSDPSGTLLGETNLYYQSGALARVHTALPGDPDVSVTDFAYSGGYLSAVREPLASEAVAAGVAPASSASTWTIAQTGGKLTGITAPEPTSGAARPARTYTYGSGYAEASQAGMSPPTGWVSRVTYDSSGRQLSQTGPDGLAATTDYDLLGRVSADVGADSMKTTYEYDDQGRPTGSWGPAPKTWWSGSGTAPIAAKQPLTPHPTNAYDEGMLGVAATWWGTATTGGQTQSTTGFPGVSGGAMNTTFATMPTSTPTISQSNFTVSFSGRLKFPTAGTWQLRVTRDGTANVDVGETQLVADETEVTTSTATTAVDHTVASANQSFDLFGSLANTNSAAQLRLEWKPPSGSWVTVPGSAITPNYSLTTSSSDPDGKKTASGYARPETGVQTSTTVDPAGAALTTSESFEDPTTSGGYTRRLTRQLPAGAASATSDSWYSATATAANPCVSGSPAVNQGARQRTRTSADPDGAGPQAPIVTESVYDLDGNTVASRVGTEPWTCATFDARGRPATVDLPAYGGNPARTVTYNYAVSGNPLATSATDPAGTVTGVVDLLGRTVSTTDVWGATSQATYNQAGQVTQTSNPVVTVERGYNNLGQLERVGPAALPMALVSYDGVGRVATVTYPIGYGNGTTGTYAYDDLGREQSLTWTGPGAALITSDSVTRSLAGRVVDQAVDGTDPNPSGANYVYDGAGRLTDAWTPAQRTQYAFAPSGGCGVATAAGKNSNRTTKTVIPAGGSPAATTFCYDHADRLTSTTTPGIGTLAYDSHGNTTELFGETHGYDQADRHLSTSKGATTVTYIRDVADRLVQREATGEPTVRYWYGDGSDSASGTTSTSGAALTSSVGLPGGASLTFDHSTSSATWQYPNLHGDLVATADSAGAKVGATVAYDPDGNLTGGGLPNNLAGDMDFGWHGAASRPLEHADSLSPTIEMGARQYNPTLGRFLETDPIEGGVDNDYGYVKDPVGLADLSGAKVWFGPNQFRCSFEWVGGAQTHFRSGTKMVGIKYKVRCRSDVHVETYAYVQRSSYSGYRRLGAGKHLNKRGGYTVKDFQVHCKRGLYTYRARVWVHTYLGRRGSIKTFTADKVRDQC
ncbi:MAG: PA14 domain-containing protein [Microthrixaceae bacterium]